MLSVLSVHSRSYACFVDRHPRPENIGNKGIREAIVTHNPVNVAVSTPAIIKWGSQKSEPREGGERVRHGGQGGRTERKRFSDLCVPSTARIARLPSPLHSPAPYCLSLIPPFELPRMPSGLGC